MSEQEDGQQVLTCVTCNVWFQSADAQRQHYKADWHRYNLKRKVVGLPAVTAEGFARRVHAQRAQSEAAATEAMQTFECAACAKSFSSRNAYHNHLNSKKHKENEKKMAIRQAKQQQQGKGGKEGGSEAAQGGKAVERSGKSSSAKAGQGKNVQPFEEQKRKYEQLMAKVARQMEREEANKGKGRKKEEEKEKTAHSRQQGEHRDDAAANGDVVDDDDDGEADARSAGAGSESGDDEEEEEPVLELVDSLFDTYRANSFEENVAYMGEKHGFFIPHVEFVDELRGLVRYLQLKVGNYFMCIYCNKACAGLEAVRKHMEDKGHKQVDYSQEGQLELGDFYDFSSTYPDDAVLSEAERDANLEVVPVKDPAGGLRLSSGLELTLPSGVSVAHRSMQHLYKQRHRRQDTRESVAVGRIAAQYKALGYRNPHVPLETQRRDQARAQRRSKREWVRIGVRQNNLHFNWGKFML